jgi:RecB family endonuclease NucS
LFYKEGSSRFRLWDKDRDPMPRYKADIEARDKLPEVDQKEIDKAVRIVTEGGDTFVYEKDLQNYLARNLNHLEAGLYEDEGLTGVEYNAGGRFIDILAIDSNGCLVVVELKVSRGYDRVIGQLLRYMGWVEANLCEGKPVRGMIVANEITEDLVLATSHIAS